MRDYLDKLPKEILDLVYLAQDIASSNDMPAYLVGGFVRDLILGVKNLDLDIVVEGNGIKVAEDFAHALNAKLIRHRRFGTATVILKSHLKIDFSTARKEYYPRPAHLPVVSPGSLKDDLFRRDFTINAMAISLSSENFGKLVDFFSGKEGLQNKKIRILHDLSFIDDPTRILRAIRFEKRYNFRIEPKTLKLLKEAVREGMLERVEPQRIRDDLILVLKEKEPLKEIKRLKELVGFRFLHPRLSVLAKNFKLLAAVEKEINWFEKAHFYRRNLDAWVIYFMGLMDCLKPRFTRAVCRRLALRRGEEKRILNAKKISDKLIAFLSRPDTRPSKIFALLEPLSYEEILLIKAKYRNAFIKKHIEDFFEIYNGMRILITGDDLRKLGLMPGPYYQKIFTRVLNAKLDGQARNREEELALIKKLIKKR